MVYEKYIKKGEKTFGPYYYESYRSEDGKVKTRFIGTTKPNNRNLYFFIILGVILLLSILFLAQNKQISESFSKINYDASVFLAKSYSFITGHAASEGDVQSSPVAETASDSPQQTSETPTNSVQTEPTQTETVTDTPEQTQTETPATESTAEPVTLNESVNESTQTSSEITNNETQIIVETNQSLNEQNITGSINETSSNVTEPISQNITENTASVIENTTAETVSQNLTLQTTTKQYSAVIGKPVKWEKKIKIESTTSQTNQPMNIELPINAGNVSVTKIDAETGTAQDITTQTTIQNEKAINEIEPVTSITGNIIALNSGNGIITRFFNFFSDLFNSFVSLTGRAVDETSNSANVSVSVPDVSANDSLIVEYYTAAPYAEETLVDNSKKEITVVGPDAVHYQDVLAYSELPSEVKSASSIKVYWTSSDSGNRQEVNFEAQDIDGNGLIDTIQWVVPHLSNQTYEIILVTKAEHLDSNRTLISDVYDSVKTLDGNWSETIANGEYARVTFEQSLDNTRDITVYARSASENASIEVYTEDGNDKIATIENIGSEGYYKTLLNDLPAGESYKTFDLKSIGNIQYDYIVDPNYPTNTSVLVVTGSLTPAANGTYIQNGTDNSHPAYMRTDGAYWIWWSGSNWFITVTKDDIPLYYWYNSDSAVTGTYLPWDYTGTATVAWANVSNYTIYDCGNITQNGTYTLNQSISSPGTCININANNVTLDCNGYGINYSTSGISGYGVNISYANSTTIKNCIITEGTTASINAFAISILNSSNDLIFNNTVVTFGGNSNGINLEVGSVFTNVSSNKITTAGATGIYLSVGSDSNYVSSNIMNISGSSSFVGVYILSNFNNILLNNITVISGSASGIGSGGNNIATHNNNISSNRISTSGGGMGFHFYSSSYFNLTGNIVTSVGVPSYYISGEGPAQTYCNNSIDSTNFAEGKPVYYVFNANNLIFDGIDFTQYGQVMFADCVNITVSNSNFSDDSLNLFATSGSTIQNNNIQANSSYGIFMTIGSNSNIISSNNITTNGSNLPGIYMGEYNLPVYYNRVLNNTVITFGSSSTGIAMASTRYNNLSSNIITTSGASSMGITFGTDPGLVALNLISSNIINTSGNGSSGIELSSSNNDLISNTIQTLGSSAYGISLKETSSFNNVSSNAITTSGSNAVGIFLSAAGGNNSFSNMNIKTNGPEAYGFDIYGGAYDVAVKDSIINSSYSPINDFYIDNSITGGIWNFTNVSENGVTPININWSTGVSGTLNFRWYLDVYANYSNSTSVAGINISIWDVNNALVNFTATDNNGNARIPLLEYIRTGVSGNSYSYFNNYTVNATTWYAPLTSSVNMSTNRNIVFTLDVTPANVTAVGPQNGTITSPQLINFTINITDNTGLANATLNIYNQSGLYNQTIIYLSGTTNAVVGIVVYLVEGVYSWFWQVVDLANNYMTTQDTGSPIGNYTLNANGLIDCGTLDKANTVYTLLNNVTTTGTCFTITADNVTINGNGFRITGNIVGSGISTGNNSYTGIVINNTNVNGTISAVGQDGSALQLGQAGGRGGSVTIINSAVNNLIASGGIGGRSPTIGSGGAGGAGGATTLLNSNVTSINSFGGAGGIVASGSHEFDFSGNGGAGGFVSSSNSIISVINASGGKSGNSQVALAHAGNGGLAGSINLNNSNIITINSNGGLVGVASAGGGTRGNGGNVTLTNSLFNISGSVSIIGLANGSFVLNQSSIKNSFGEIKFSYLNTTQTAIINILSISNNLVYVNSTNYPDYNVSANVTFYGLPTNFALPKIYKDEAVCMDCHNFTSLNAGTVVFNVSSWSNYSIVETGVLVFCGDGICNNGETTSTCSADCHVSGCSSTGCAGASTIACGTSYVDNCGTTCGTGTKCNSGYSCTGGTCVLNCVPKTCFQLGKQCGSSDDGCGNTLNCGICASGFSCSNGQCVFGCAPKTCSDLGLTCGTAIDGCSLPSSIDCGTCDSGYNCVSGSCQLAPQCDKDGDCDNGQKCVSGSCQTLAIQCLPSCSDGYICTNGVCIQGVTIDPKEVPANLPSTGASTNCQKSFICGAWSACSVNYNVASLLTGDQPSGERKRVCADKNKCFSNFEQKENCTIKEEVEVRTKNWCGQNYTEVVGKTTGKVLARISALPNGNFANLNFNVEGEGTCAYCSDGIKDYDEENIDCGGPTCLSCTSSILRRTGVYLAGTIYGYLLPLFMLFVFLSMLTYTLRFVFEYTSQVAVNWFVRQYGDWKKEGYDVFVLDEDIKKIKRRL